MKDLCKKKFGKLTAEAFSNGKWKCVCDCGNAKEVATGNLTSGSVKSCGCLVKEIGSSRRIPVNPGDIYETKYGKLEVIEELDKVGQFRIFSFKCFCGTIFSARLNGVKTGNTGSCGCIAKAKASELNKSHGLSGSLVHKRWKSMLTRATNPNIINAHNYTGRGIGVCERWKKFENFLEDMGEILDEKLTLDRIDNDKGYYKENCRWATAREQNRNKERAGKVKGVVQLKSGNWRVFIATDECRNKHVGMFKTYEEACLARRAAETKYWSKEGALKPTENDPKGTSS